MTEQEQGQVTPERAQPEEQAAQATETEGQPEGSVEQPKVEAKYTDADVDKLKGNARTEARERRDRELMEKYNIGTLEDLDSIVQSHRETEEANRSDVEKAEARAGTLETELQTANTELEEAYSTIARVVTDAELKLALINEGAREDKLEKLLREADRDAIDVDENGSVTGIKDEVKRLKKEEADWFGSVQRAGVPLSPSGSGGASKGNAEEARRAERERTMSTF